jgi:hypothetical protein
MTNFTLDVSSGGQIRLSFDTAYSDENLSQCLQEFALLLKANLDADNSLLVLGEHTPVNRIRAMAGIRAKYEYHIGQALALMTGLNKVAAGEMMAAQFGFPEFGDDAAEGQFD